MGVYYEWVCETLDWYEGCEDDPDIIECSFGDTLEEVRNYVPEEAEYRFGLVRNVGNEIEGLTDRSYAYFDKDGNLSEFFEYLHGAQDGAKVPKRFHKEEGGL